MANYHVMEGERGNYQVVFHLSVPDELNKAGTSNIRAALAEDATVGKTSRLPWINAAEQADLTNGILFERVENFSTNTAHPLSQDRARLDARFTQLVTVVANRLRQRYAFWRFERNVP